MNLEVHTHPRVFDELESEWNALLHSSPSDQIFLTWEWQSTWWNVYHEGDLWVLTCRKDDGRLVGIAPWFIDAERTVRVIGCEDVTDYLDLIVDRCCVDEVLACYADFLADHSAEYGYVELCNLPQASPLYERFPKALEHSGLQVSVEQQEVCPIIELPETWDEYLQSLDKKQRHEIRRKLRRASGAGEGIEWYTVDPQRDLTAKIECFLSLMAASDAEKYEFLQDEQNVTFFRQLIPLIAEAGWLQLNFLTVGGEETAAYLNFSYNNRILVYNSGLTHEHYAHLSPGIVLLARLIRDAIEQGYEVFDFLRGNETYKYHMGGKDTSVYKLTAKPA